MTAILQVGKQLGRRREHRKAAGSEPVKDKKVLGATIMADGVNLRPAKLAEATDDSKVTYERLAWASDWHVRDETYQSAIEEVVNAHRRLRDPRYKSGTGYGYKREEPDEWLLVA